MGVGVDGWVVIRFAFWQGQQRTGTIQIRRLKPVSARLQWPQGGGMAQIKKRNSFQELRRGRLNSTIILKGMCGEWERSYRWSQVSGLQVWEVVVPGHQDEGKNERSRCDYVKINRNLIESGGWKRERSHASLKAFDWPQQEEMDLPPLTGSDTTWLPWQEERFPP